MRILRWICSTSLSDKVPSVELKWRKANELVTIGVKRNLLSCLGHVLRKDDDDWVKESVLYEMDGVIGRGRPRMTWNKLVENDMRECGLNKVDAQEWRGVVW